MNNVVLRLINKKESIGNLKVKNVQYSVALLGTGSGSVMLASKIT